MKSIPRKWRTGLKYLGQYLKNYNRGQWNTMQKDLRSMNRVRYWWAYWIRWSKTESYRSWSGARNTRWVYELRSYLTYLEHNDQKLYRSAKTQIAKRQRLGYWWGRWTTVKRSSAYKKWHSKHTARNTAGFKKLLHYLKYTNMRMYNRVQTQINEGIRVSFWWRYWTKLSKTTKYSTWLKNHKSKVNAGLRKFVAYLKATNNK